MLTQIVYQPFLPAILLQDFKGLPQDQTDQLKTDNLCYKKEVRRIDQRK